MRRNNIHGKKRKNNFGGSLFSKVNFTWKPTCETEGGWDSTNLSGFLYKGLWSWFEVKAADIYSVLLWRQENEASSLCMIGFIYATANGCYFITTNAIVIPHKDTRVMG